MRTKVIDMTDEILVTLQKFAASKNVSVKTVESWAKKGLVRLIRKNGKTFVNIASSPRSTYLHTFSAQPTMHLEIHIPRPKAE